MVATDKQISYAKDIAEWFGVELPKDTTKESYSAFLEKYAPVYRREMKEESLLHEVEMEIIDAMRDY